MSDKFFDHVQIEADAQRKWNERGLHFADLTDEQKEKYFLLFEFPYPSGDLHTGHWYAFALNDILARYLKMKGKNVLFPIGFDSFGLPAENAAIKNGISPFAWIDKSVSGMREQVKKMGTLVDWTKEIDTSSPEFYKWTQWLFLKFYEQGVAYRKKAPVKWCPQDQTVLANEQVIDGHCERCDAEVEEKQLTQWFMKITDYADRLLADLEPLPWKNDIKEAQRQWIGKSTGALLTFSVVDSTEAEKVRLDVFTTRPDTVFGATYIVVAPDHALIEHCKETISNMAEITDYQARAKRKTELERTQAKEKTGVRVEGIQARNPATRELIPVYVADYVLSSYGTGAIMAVPAHDERDFEFARKYDLPIQQVVVPCKDDAQNPPQQGFEEVRRETVIVHLKDTQTGKFALLKWHGTLTGITTAIMGGVEEGQTPEEAALAELKEEAGITTARIVKQTPFITAARYCASHKQQNRLAHAYGFLAEVDGLSDVQDTSAYEKETHTLFWIDESDVEKHLTPAHQKLVWSLLNTPQPVTDDGYLINSGTFTSRDNKEAIADILKFVNGESKTQFKMRDWLVSRQRYWGCPIPIVYDPEGNPHPVKYEHLPWKLPTDADYRPTGKPPLASSKELHERVESLYGAGWTPEYDTFDGFMDNSWYFIRYLDPHNDEEFAGRDLIKRWLPVDRYSGGAEHTTVHLLYSRFFYKVMYDLGLVPTHEPYVERYNRGILLAHDGRKMSKRWGNVVNPDEYVAKLGSDTVRLYLAFMGPYNETGSYPWNDSGIEAMRRFLDRTYALRVRTKDLPVTSALNLELQKATAKVNEDIPKYKYNTALAALMTLLNALEKEKEVPYKAYQHFITLLSPFAPHLCEHLSGREVALVEEVFPEADSSVISAERVVIAVQVNGKKRGEVLLPRDSEKEAVQEAIQSLETVQAALKGHVVAKEIFVKNRIFNIVTE